jgi:hypothetical protein
MWLKNDKNYCTMLHLWERYILTNWLWSEVGLTYSLNFFGNRFFQPISHDNLYTLKITVWTVKQILCATPHLGFVWITHYTNLCELSFSQDLFAFCTQNSNSVSMKDILISPCLNIARIIVGLSLLLLHLVYTYIS